MLIAGIEINPDAIWYIQEAAEKDHTLVKIWKQKDKINIPLPIKEVIEILRSAGHEVKW